MKPSTLTFVLSIVLPVFGAFLTFVMTRYWYIRGERARETTAIARAAEELSKRVDLLDKQLALITQAVVPISAAYQSILVRELTHYHTPEMDALMVKLGPPVTLTEDEELRLLELLRQREEDMGASIGATERDAASILPIVIKRTKVEMRFVGDASRALQLVVVPMPVAEKPETP
jgi:hypothetical protein